MAQRRAGPGPATSCHLGEGLPPSPFLLSCPVGGGLVFPPGYPGLWAPSALLCWQTQEN